jgi:hypothetical protein
MTLRNHLVIIVTIILPILLGLPSIIFLVVLDRRRVYA